MNVSDVDFLRRRIEVERQVQKRRGGPPEIRGTEVRVEPDRVAPDELLQMLARHVEEHPTPEAGWLFTGLGRSSSDLADDRQQLVAADHQAAGVEGVTIHACGTTSHRA